MVYLSNPTEVGTLYTKEELTAISAACYELGLYLFVDGARMAYGLTSPANDLTLQDYAALCDVFYLGGTKCGALFGEAVVITNDELKGDFRYCIKQHGGMLAKGRLLGEQFLALLDGEDGSGCSLYFTMAKKADEQALRIRAAFEEKAAVCCTIPRRTSSSLSCPMHGTKSWLRLCHDPHGQARQAPHRRAHLHQLGHEGRGSGTASRRCKSPVSGLFQCPRSKKNPASLRCGIFAASQSSAVLCGHFCTRLSHLIASFVPTVCRICTSTTSRAVAKNSSTTLKR